MPKPPYDLPRHRTVAHLHVLNCLNTLLELPEKSEPIRILDIGCGNGEFMAYLQKALTVIHPEQNFELYGFDIADYGWGESEEYQRAIKALETDCPGIEWRERLVSITGEEAWPFPDDYFDAAVSTFVIEHVPDMDHFLANLGRVVRPEGQSIHIFPLVNMLYEGHIDVPLAHWFKDINGQSAWITLANRLGIGRWKKDREIFGISSLKEYGEHQAAYLHSGTHYRNLKVLHQLCRKHGLSLSHRFTRDFYRVKLNQILKRPQTVSHKREKNALISNLSFLLLRHVSAVTLDIRHVSYDLGARKHAQQASAKPELKAAAQ
ncbi:MAG: class I SAM-dependent methyltransferase [Stappiaceae bacterium]